jgi:hypothetical protein
LLLKKSEFDEYIRSEEYAEDNAAATILAMVSLKVPPSTGGGSGNGVASGTAATGSNVVPETMTAKEFRRGVKWDIAHYPNFKDDEHFSAWHWKFVATARMHHTHLVLDPKYVPQDDVAKAAFEETQISMYVVMAGHLKTDKRKSLVSQYEKDHDAQSIYHDLKKHALGSTSAWMSGDTLLKNWRGTASAFVLHWNKQVEPYETLEVEDFPPKQKLRMIQNAIGDMTELAHVRQLADLGVANGNTPLTYDSYLALLLESCAPSDTQQLFLATIWMNHMILLMMQDIMPIQLTRLFWKSWLMRRIQIDPMESLEIIVKALVGFPTLSGLR